MNKGEQLILPGTETPAEVRAAIERENLDRADAERGTNRNIDLLRQRTFRTESVPSGLPGQRKGKDDD